MTINPKRRGPVRRTAEQLRSMAWDDRESALRDLKASKMPAQGEDYELREYKRGSWQLMPIDPIPEPEPEVKPAPRDSREDRVLASLRKQPGKPARGAPVVIVSAEPMQRRHGKHTANGITKPKGTKIPEVKAAVAEPVRAVSLFEDVDEPPVAEQAPPPATEAPAVPLHDLSPLPAEGAPYELVLREGEGFGKHGSVTAAIDVSRRLRVPVVIRDKAGVIRREINWSSIQKSQKTISSQRRSVVAGAPRAERGESKFTRAARLLFRTQGATAAELEAECGWVGVTQRFINRASKFNDDAEIKILGPKHWRLIKRKA